jgi:hypothetical protein
MNFVNHTNPYNHPAAIGYAHNPARPQPAISRLGQQTRLVLRHPVPLRDAFICQPWAYPRPCDQELVHAVVEVFAIAAVVVERWLIVHVAAPPPANSGAFHDPAYRQAAPEHGEVIRVTRSADHGDVQGNGFIDGHQTNFDPT